jgi:regulator of sigma E protease
MSPILVVVLQFFASLSILVMVHELGHFLMAKIFKVRVEKFYLFFNPWLTLLKFKPKNSETEYGIGWLPLGGYVKMAGMIDESLDGEQMKKEPEPWEFRTKPAWQRLLIIVMGVVFNFILAILIYSMVAFHYGDEYIPFKNVTSGMEFSELAKEIGFQDGDILLRADSLVLEKPEEASFRAILEADKVYVLRNGEEAVVDIPEDFILKVMEAKTGFLGFRYPFVVDSVIAGSRA